jgi:hypothetical protein
MTDPRSKPYRTEIPNLIDDLGLDPHERALYVHYKRACGADSEGEWIEGIRITAKRTKMSSTRASQARAQLKKRGLIRTIRKGNEGTAIKVIDIWELNTTFYRHDYKPDIDGWTVEQVKEWCLGVRIVNTNDNTPPQEQVTNQGVNYTNTLENEPEGVTSSEGVSNVDTSVNNTNTNEPGVNDKDTSVNNANHKKEPIRIKDSFSNEKGEKSPPKNKSSSEKSKDPPPPAIKVYQINAHRFPKKSLWPMIVETIGERAEDLERWGEVVLNYIACGWNPTNIKAMLEFFKRQEIPSTYSKNGAKNERKTTQAARNRKPGIIAQTARAPATIDAQASGSSRDAPARRRPGLLTS